MEKKRLDWCQRHDGRPWPMQVGRDGRLYQRQGRWKYFQVYGKRCWFCHRGILWIMNETPRRQIAIAPRSWNGEEWYIRGKHEPHARACVEMREWLKGNGRRGGRERIPMDLIL